MNFKALQANVLRPEKPRRKIRFRRVLNWEKVKEIRGLLPDKSLKIIDIAKQYDVSPENINSINMNTIWKDPNWKPVFRNIRKSRVEL